MGIFDTEPEWAGGDTSDESWQDDGQEYDDDTTPATPDEVDDHSSDDTVPVTAPEE